MRFPSLLWVGTWLSEKSLQPMMTMPGLFSISCAMRTVSSGVCCPSPSTVMTPRTSGRFLAIQEKASRSALPLPLLTSCTRRLHSAGCSSMARAKKHLFSSWLPSSTMTMCSNPAAIIPLTVFTIFSSGSRDGMTIAISFIFCTIQTLIVPYYSSTSKDFLH